MKIKVLDHGYVEFIEAWGRGKGSEVPDNSDWSDNERGVIEAARQSTQGSFRGWDKDQKLLEFLYTNKHATPFEFAGMVIEVQAPIFVFREWHRHRTQSYNEMSARYAPLPELYYQPESTLVMERTQEASITKNRQAGMARELTVSEVSSQTSFILDWLKTVDAFYARAEQLYQAALSAGIPKELARITMPVGHYSRMRASANLRNWLAFLTLRTDPKAQWEIRQYAEAVYQIVKQTFPRTAELWAVETFVKREIDDKQTFLGLRRSMR